MSDAPYRRADGQPTIGLAIIAKDEEEALPRLLDSLGWTELPGPEGGPEAAEHDGTGIFREESAVDFVVVCDTGSEDDTVEIARRRGCRVVEFEWCDHFGKARQASYDALPAGLDFTMWADCDDVIPEAARLREIASRIPPAAGGTIHRYDYAQDEMGNCICELWRERLVRPAAIEGWDLPIHEVLRVSAPLVHVPDVPWVHRQPHGRARDPERNYKILSADLEAARLAGSPPSVRTLAYLGTEALALGRTEEAIERFHAYLARPDAGWDQERCQVAHKLSIALRLPLEGETDEDVAERLDEAQEAAYRAISERPDWADGYNDLAEIALRRDEPERALHFCETAMRLEPPQTLLIINPLEYDYQPQLMRSVALAKLGRTEEAMDATQRLLAVTPQRPDLLAQAAGLQQQLAIAEAEAHVLALREILVRHDENDKARRLMECAPYFLVDRPAIAAARLDQREMTLHATDPQVYGSYYRENPNEAPFERTGIPISEAHKRFHRVEMLRRGLLEQAGEVIELDGGSEALVATEEVRELRVLDLSCNDGWMLKNLSIAGFGTAGALDGMDLNRDAAARAQDRLDPGASGATLAEADAKRAPARIVCGDLHTAPEFFDEGSYDAVVCFETIEHVPDPEATLALMARMAKPGGRLYVSTPDGAYEGGNVPGWARVESKGHLRALRSLDVASLIAPLGLVAQFEVAQRLVACSVTNEPRRGRVDLYAGPVDALPEKISDEGLGGSETALCKVAEHLARRGYDVRVFCGTEGGLRGDHVTVGEDRHTGGSVLYAPAAAWDPGAAADLFVSSRAPEALDRTIAAPRRALWLHDADYGERLTAERASRATDVIVLSEFQRRHLVDRYPFLAAHPGLYLSRNGIETSFFRGGRAKRRPWAVYSSSPDRGLDVLLEMWPRIAERVPGAELHHTYAPVYAQFRDAYPHLAAFHARVVELSAAARRAGAKVVAHEHMGQRELAALYRRARCWAYPSWTSALADGSSAPFPEISCISAMEAQAAGAVPVALRYGALPETVAAGELIEQDGVESLAALPEAWRSRFVEAVVRALTDDEYFDEHSAAGREHGAALDWSGVVDAWEEALLSPRRAPVLA